MKRRTPRVGRRTRESRRGRKRRRGRRRTQCPLVQEEEGGEPGYGEGDHEIENMQSADIGLATNQPARGSGLLDSSYDANEELFRITYLGRRQK